MGLSIVLTAPRTLESRNGPEREPRPGWARVRVEVTGICGTDLAIWSGEYAVPLPRVLGHEWVGRVEATGRPEDERWLGRRVCGGINYTCRSLEERELCPLCRAGLESHCRRRTVTGIVGQDGSFQECLEVPVANLVELPAEIGDEEAVFAEPLAAALQTFRMTALPEGSQVVVLGPGRLGLLVALVARERGDRVLLAGGGSGSERLAAALGFETFPVRFESRGAPEGPLAPWPSALRERVIESTGGVGADAVVDTTGTSEAIDWALDLVRPRGTICVKSTPGTSATLNLTRLVVGEIALQGSRCGDLSEALAFIRRTRPPLSRLIRARFPLGEAEAAFRAAQLPGKVLLLPPARKGG